MAGFLDEFKKSVASSIWKDQSPSTELRKIDDKIALGVLLWVVAEADNKFLPQEEDKIKETLILYSKISQQDLPRVLASIKEAALQRIDLYRFTSEISQGLDRDTKIKILEDLFRVGCSDKDLDDRELELIRKISGLFNLTHKDFIEAKIKIKKEAGLDTAGL